MTRGHLRFRLWVDGELTREDWLPGATLDGDLWLLETVGVRAEAPEPWLIEVYDPGGADADEEYLRFGSDAAGMVVPVVLIGSDDVAT